MTRANLIAILGAVTLIGGPAALPSSGAFAEGDWPYGGNSTQDFENDYRVYKNNPGYRTNFINELLPLGNFGNDGRLKFESRDVEQRGSQATRLDHSNTGLQLDFKF